MSPLFHKPGRDAPKFIEQSFLGSPHFTDIGSFVVIIPRQMKDAMDEIKGQFPFERVPIFAGLTPAGFHRDDQFGRFAQRESQNISRRGQVHELAMQA